MARQRITSALVLWDRRFGAEGIAPRGEALTDSDYTEAGRRPAEPVRLNGRLLAVVTGSQTATVDVEVVTPGTGRRDGAAVVCSLDGGTTPIGHSREGAVRYWELLQAKTTGKSWTRLSCVTIPSTGQPLVALAADNDGADYRFDGTSWVGGTFANGGVAEEGVALCYDTTANVAIKVTWDGTTLRTYHNAGGTSGFDLVSEVDLVGSYDPIGRISAAATPAGILLLMQEAGVGGDVVQVVSPDLGLSWVPIATHAALGLGVTALAMPDDSIAAIYYRVSDDKAVCVPLSTPWVPIADASEYEISGRTGLKAVTGWVDASGRLWALIVDAGAVVSLYSLDGGRSWAEDHHAYTSRSASVGPRNMAGCHTPWGAMVVHSGASPSNPDQDESAHVMWMGGWSSVQWADSGASEVLGDGGTLWLPHAAPGGGLWTKTGAGTGDLGDGLQLDGQVYYEDFTMSSGATLPLDFRVNAGGALTALEIGARPRWKVGTTNYELEIRCTTTGFRLRDAIDNSNIDTIALDMTERVQMLVSRTALLYRRPTDLTWTKVTYTLVGAATNLEGRASWGQYEAVGTDSTWYGAGWSPVGIIDGSSQIGRPSPMWLPPAVGSARITLLDGPGLVGDSAALVPSADYPVTASMPDAQPSPSVRWRTTTADVAADVVWDLGTASWIGGGIALALSGMSARLARLSRYDESGDTWVEVVEADLATGFIDLAFERDGDIIRPDVATTTAAGRYIQEGELVGGYAILPGDVCRRIVRNSGGLWAQGSPVVPRIQLESASGVPLFGDITLVAPGGVVVGLPALSPSVRRWRLRIPIQPAPDDRFEAGLALIGRLLPMGAQPDWTWTDDAEPNVSRSRSPYGTARTREVGPVARTWSWGWGDGMLLRDLRSADPDRIDHVGAAGGQGLVGAEDVWWSLVGALRSHQALPVVALRTVPASGETVTDPTQWLYGDIEGSVSVRGAAGEEGVDEHIRVERLTVAGQS